MAIKRVRVIRRRSIGTLVVLLFVLSFSITPALMFTDLNFGPGPKKFTDEEHELNLSTNYLFKGTIYTFNLDDFYDDVDLYKVYTGTKFQTEDFNGTTGAWSGVVNNDTVLPVDNDETQYGTPSGDYNGTYSFVGEVGLTGTSIGFITHNGMSGGTCEVLSDKEDHNEILYLNPSADWQSAYNGFTQQTTGTVELWFLRGQNNINSITQLRQGGGAAFGEFLFRSNGEISFYNGAHNYVQDYVANQWYHISIQFSCITDTINLTIDRDRIFTDISFQNDLDYVSRLYFSSHNDNDAGLLAMYIDAVGYKTEDYLATESFDYETEEGVYYGTYDFRDEDIGDEDAQIDGFSAPSSGKFIIVAENDDHKKVLHHIDSLVAWSWYQYLVPDYQVSGTIEFYLDDITRVTWRLRGDGNEVVAQINIEPTRCSVQYGDGLGGAPYTGWYTYTTNFPHFKVTWDCTTDKFSVWCEGVLILDNENFAVDADLDSMRRWGWYHNGPSEFYFDAIGFSSDTTSHSGLGYEVGYNANPYDIEPLLDTGYGLDLGYNVSINVNPNVDGHANVIELYDNDIVIDVNFEFTFDSPIIDDTVEFWWRYEGTSTSQNYLRVIIYSETGTAFSAYFNYQNSGTIRRGWNDIIYATGVSAEVFHHIKIIFDDTAETFEFFVDSVSTGSFDYNQATTGTITSTRFYTRPNSLTIPFWHWIDAYGNVGDPNYNIGDNLGGWDKDYTIGENIYPDNINMISGSYDYTDNMKINDDSSTNFTSTHTDGYIHEMPHQWDNFTFTNGTGITIGELETIDADPSVIRDDYFSIDDFVSIIPDGDSTPLDWIPNPPGTHWSKIDEDPDSNDGQTTQLVVVMDNGVLDVIDYSPGDIEGGSVYKIVVRYAYKGTGPAGYDASIDINLGGWQGYKQVARPGVDFTAQDLEWTGLSGNQSDVNAFQIRLKSRISGLNANYFTAIWVKVYYSGSGLDLDVQIDMQVDDPDCSSIEYFKFSHKTNVSATIDLDIWNWDTTTWFEIESVDNFATFDDDSFTLGSSSDYVNSSFGVRIRFQLNTGSDDFELQIDRFRLDYFTTLPPAELEITITFPFVDYNEDLLAMTVQSWQRTNISQTIAFKIWNYDTEAWVQISSSSDTTFTKKEYNTESPANFISPAGIVKLNWTGLNITNDFELHIDYLFIQIFYKLNLVYSKSFDTNGIYRYRWEITGSIHYTDWVTFEVVDPVPNFHAISESDNPTRWLLQGAEISPVENFTDDIAPSSDWDLYDVSPDDFNIYVPDLDNYLTDYITFYGSSYVSPAQWGEFAFTKGAGNTVGELETNDADEAIVDAGVTYSDESLLGIIIPDGDILTEWNDGDPPSHYSLIREDDPPDGGNIREGLPGANDRWNFDFEDIPIGRVVTKLVFYAYCYEQSGVNMHIHITTSVGATGDWYTSAPYSWKDDTATGLSFGQAELNSFWMNVEPVFDGGLPGWVDIEAVYVEVFTSLIQYSVDYTIIWDVVDPESIDIFYYDYRTTTSIDCDLDIYNWDTTNWLELESNTGTGWFTDNYTLTDPYISISDEIKVRFQSALTTTNFDMELDMIVLEYNSIYTISKKHNNTIPGYAYMQTNTTELISLNSSVYGSNYTLSSGDYFEIDFQTSSDSLINLILLRDGVVNETLIVSSIGNTNFNRHTVQIPVGETVEFDQLRFSSTFWDKNYFKCWDIKTYKYEITGDTADFYVGSHQDHNVYLIPDYYNLKIFEGVDKKIDDNITIVSGNNDYIYKPTEVIQCRITLFTPEKETYLQFENYHIKVNRSLNGAYDDFWLVDITFYADIETDVYIEVYDRFDSSINNFTRSTTDVYIDLEIEVYSLEIINLMTQMTTVDINTTLYKSELASGRWINFMLSERYYQIGYYNPSNIYTQFIIYLDSNQVYELNMSRICNIYYTNQQMEPLSFYQFKTYINGTRIINNMFYATDGEHKGIEVKDLSDISVLNHTYVEGTEELNQISLILTQYSLKVMSLQLCFNHINITRDPNYYESSYYWSEWLAPRETTEYFLFAGYYVINITNYEDGGWSEYAYTLNGDDYILIGSNNTIYDVLVNIANVNATIGNQITNVLIDITNQNSYINNSVINIEINLGNINSTLGTMLTNIDVNIQNLESDIASLYTFTNTSIWNLNSAMNNSFIYLENNIYSINQSISTLVIGIDNSISLVNATINSMFTEMSNQFIVVQSTLNYSFAFLNQTIIQLANNITDNHVILYNLIEQRANEINSSLIDVQTLINLVNNTVADESLVIQTLVNLIGANITNNHIIINNLLNLIDNNITNNNIQLVSILEIIGNNITTNHFVIQTLLDLIGNNITDNHIELLTNLNLINTTISQNQIELINRLLFINNTVNDLMFELTNQLLFLNGTIYSAVLNLSTSVEFGVDMVLGNITITYQQNEFLTELYKETMFSQLLNWSGVAYNYTLMEDRIDVWTFINNYKNQSIEVHLKYQDLIEKLVISADDLINQYLPSEDVEYNLWSVADEEYLDDWKELDPKNKTVDFGFYETEVPTDPLPQFVESLTQWLILGLFTLIPVIVVIYASYKMKIKNLKEEKKARTKGTNPIGTGKGPYF